MSEDVQTLIVGAGVGGLSLAVALREIGLDPVVIERAESLASPDGTVELWSDTMTMLQWLGVDDAVRENGTAVSAWSRRGADGTVGNRLESADGPGLVAVDYRQLRDRLRDRLPERTVRTDTAFRSLEPESDRVIVRFENGVREVFDLVVGADGSRSDVRHSLGRTAAVSCGTASAAFSLNRDDTDAEWLAGAAEVWTTDGVVLTAIPTGDRLTGWVTVPIGDRDADRDRPRIADGSSLPIDWVLPDVLDTGGFEGDTGTGDGVRTTAFREDVCLREPVWAEGRVALVGDAAHARHRLTGCGVTLAVEDAVVLASAIRDGTDPLPTRLDEYASRRAERTGGLFGTAERRAPLADVEPTTTDERAAGDRARVLDVRSERLRAGFGDRHLRPAVDPL